VIHTCNIFCGEEYRQHTVPLERSGRMHFRNRVGDEALETLLQKTLAAAHRGGALSVRATGAVAVDPTVREKALAHPTEHRPMLAAIEQVGSRWSRSARLTPPSTLPRMTSWGLFYVVNCGLLALISDCESGAYQPIS
jgi:hypothetical protein